MCLVSIARVGGERCEPAARGETREPAKVLKSRDALEHLGAVADRIDEAAPQLALADSGPAGEIEYRAWFGGNASHNLCDRSCDDPIRLWRIGHPLQNQIFKRKYCLSEAVRSIKTLP